MKPPNTFTHRTPNPNLPKATSTPHKIPSSKHPSSYSYWRESPRLSQVASTSNDKKLAWPPLSSRNEPKVSPGINPLINDKPDEKPNKLTPNIRLFILNSNAIQSMNIQQIAKIINEVAYIYLLNHMLIQAKKDTSYSQQTKH